MIGSLVYLLCGLTSTLCFVLLLRGYRQTRSSLLLRSSICFAGLAANNVLLYFDLVITAGIDVQFLGISLALWRAIASLVGVWVLLYGMLSEGRQ